MKQAKLLFLLIAVLAFASCRPTARQAVADVEQPTDSTEAVTSADTLRLVITAKRITDKHHFTWTHLVEAKDMMAWIGYEGFPLTIVVDKKGIVRHAVHGTNETKREELLSKIKEAEAE